MTKHLITYDLCNPGRNYESLYFAIKACGECKQICESSWVVKSDLSDIQIWSFLIKHIDANDKLFVCTFNPDWAQYGLSKEKTDFLNY